LVDANLDGKADHAYAGDIDGNLWRFDLASAQSGDWSATLLLATSPAQAITTAPVVASHPAGGRMVVFGTGRILDENDVENGAVHFVYGLWDGAPSANEAWLDQTVTEVQSGSQRLRLISSHTPNWSSGGHRGWRLALPDGERVVGDGQFISDDRFYFVGTNPSVTSATAFSAEGANWFMEVQYLTGGSPVRPIFDVNADGVIGADDNVSGGVAAGKYLGEGVSSQAVLADQTRFGQALFNRQSDIDIELPKVGTDSGVSGGHFDLDFYVTSNNVFNSVKHTHQYDDKYNVTGVNFLNASDATYNLGSRLGSGVRFKVLAINQYLSPASQLQIGGGAFVSVKNYGALTTTADPAAALAGLPAYTLSTVSTLTWKIGAEGFTAKDWWGDGGVARAGLIPSKTGCVKNITSQGGTGSPGPNGEVHNGAMTLQVIKEETPASALEPNHSGGDLKYGWRVKTSEFTKYVLAEYTMFWHHPSGKCYGDVGWVPNPTKSTGGKVTLTTVGSGSADPNEGTAEILPKGVTITNTAVAMVGATTTVTVTYSDKKTSITEITNNGNGTETVVLTDRSGVKTNGTRMSAGAVGQAPDETLVASRRINWREVVRP
jgi:archaellum component FlaF (FlaF/FlaG flagellin family)